MTDPADPLELDPVLGPRHKSIPPGLWGLRASDAAAARPPIDDFPTPLLTLDRSASDANVELLTRWAADRGLTLAPHGKTTMAPALWRRLLDAGCWGLTLATPWQAQVARAAGVDRILLANEVTDPAGAAWIAAELDTHPRFESACWVDSVDAVALLAATPGERPIDVLVELGGTGGRTGARGVEAALEVADAVAAEPRLRLRGVTGYEGSYGFDRDPATVAAVRAYLAQLAELAGALLDAHRIPDPMVSAGGSTWFDLVADELGPLTSRARVILRSGAFQAHDDLFYADTSPFGPANGAVFRPALTVRTRVLSRPEPGVAVLDAGKRDLPYDYDLPVVLRTAGGRELPGARIVSLADQHARVELPAETVLEPGEVVLLGISHPCSAFDRWRLIPEVDDARGLDPRVQEFVATVF